MKYGLTFYFRSALTSIVLSDLSKDRLIGLLPKRSKKPKQGLETILELDERLRARNLRSRFLFFVFPKQNRINSYLSPTKANSTHIP